MRWACAVYKVTPRKESRANIRGAVRLQWKWSLLIIEACIQGKTRQLSSGQLVQIKDDHSVPLKQSLCEKCLDHPSNVVLRTLAFQARIVLEMNQLTPYVAA